MHSARPRGAMSQVARPQVMINMTLDLAVVAFNPTALADHVSPHVVTAFLK
jgi:hypothetical protein